MQDIVYLWEASPYDPVSATTKNVRFASGLVDEYVPGSPGPYPLRLQTAFAHETTIFEQNVPGQTSISLGATSVNNRDGAYDYLLDYVWDTRPVTIKKGFAEANYSTFTTEFVGGVVEVTADQGSLVFTLRDNSYKLNKPMQTNFYVGNGGKEGGLDLRGKTKPLLFGSARNITPILVDNVMLTAQIHDGPITSVSAVYDRANALTFQADFATYALLVASTIQPGKYGTCLAEGFVRLGAPPVGSPVVDAVGQYNNSTPSDMLKSALLGRAGLVAGDLDTTAFTTLASDFPYAFEGVYFLEPAMDWSDFMEVVVSSLNGYWYVKKNGLVSVGQFRFRTPSATIRMEDVTSLGKASSPSVPFRLRVGWGKNPTVQSGTDFVIPRQTLNGYITRPTQYISTAADGTGGVYTTDSVFNTFLNNTLVNNLDSVLYAVMTTSPWVTITPAGVISITDPGADTATATLRGNIGEINIDLPFTVTRTKGSSKNITITVDRDHMVFDDLGAPVGNQDVTFTVATTGLTGAVTASAVDNLGQTVAVTTPAVGQYKIASSAVGTSPLVFWADLTVQEAGGISQKRRTIIQRGNDGFAAGILDAYASSGNAVTIYYQDDPPVISTSKTGDLWFDTNDTNKLYRRDATSWVLSSDTRIAQALSDAASATGAANTKVTSFFQETTPTALAVGNIWYKPSTQIVTRWDGTTWAAISTYGSKIGSTLFTSTGAATSDPALLNSAVTINSAGVLSGAGGGAVTIGGLGYFGALDAGSSLPLFKYGIGTFTVAGNSIQKLDNDASWSGGYGSAGYLGHVYIEARFTGLVAGSKYADISLDVSDPNGATPFNTVAPVISGVTTAGSVLTVTSGTWSNVDPENTVAPAISGTIQANSTLSLTDGIWSNAT